MIQPATDNSPTISDKPKHRIFRNLELALEEKRIPSDNHSFLIQLIATIDVQEVSERSAYIHVKRREPGPDIHIHSGWTEGFASAQEITNVHPTAEIHEYGTKFKRWYVVHPENRLRGHETMAAAERVHEVCSVCFTQRAANGTCSCY